LFALAVVLAWVGFGRNVLPLSDIVGLAPFLLAKAKIYSRAGRDSAKQWTPTRSGETNGAGE
ncbi:MAG: hypothetical protein ACX939_09310, partial [Hyphococcus sp.]